MSRAASPRGIAECSAGRLVPGATSTRRCLATWGTVGAWLALVVGGPARAADWAQWGGSPQRNNVAEAHSLPATWNVGQIDRKTHQWLGGPAAHNIRWVARLGSECYGTPVVAGDKVFCATNNGAGYLARYPAEVDLGCLLAFRRSDGRFLWQYSSEKLKAGRNLDYPEQGICSCPLVEGDRLWLVTNRGLIVCLDTEGFLDNENDGPVQSEPSTAPDEADVVWTFDMMRQLGSVQRYMCSSSVTSAGDLLFACTSNGVDLEDRLPAPDAPSFIALDKGTGQLVWADNSPGRNILDGQWSSPAYGVLGGVGQVIFAGGDGWLYSFLAERAAGGKPRLLWRFDCNPKDAVWEGGGRGRRNQIIATPVIYEGRVYVATGQEPEAGEGPGDLWCIDPTRRGDTSPTLVLDRQARPVPPRRLVAVDPQAGEQVRPNPNSAVVWHYTGEDRDGDGTLQFEETMHRAMGMVAIKDDILVIGDYAGLVHCLDARTGRLYWTYDMLAAVWGSPLIADGKIYLGDEDGDVVVLALSKQREVLGENNMQNAVYTAPVAADNTLYIATRRHLFAISTSASDSK